MDTFNLQDRFETTGSFWLPGAEGNPVDGTFSYAPADEIALKLGRDFDRVIYSGPTNDPIIYGRLSDGTKVTLIDAFVRRIQFIGRGPAEIVVNRVLFGGHYHLDLFKSRRVRLEFTSLEEWLDFRPFETTYDTKIMKASASVQQPPVLEVNIPSRHLKIMVVCSVSYGADIREARLNYSAGIAIESPFDLGLDEWVAIIYECQNLFTLLLGHPVDVRQAAFTPADAPEKLLDRVFYVVVSRAKTRKIYPPR